MDRDTYVISRELVGSEPLPDVPDIDWEAVVRGGAAPPARKKTRATYTGTLVLAGDAVVLMVGGVPYGPDDLLPWGMTGREFAFPEAVRDVALALMYCGEV